MLCLQARPVPELTWRASPQHASPLRTHPCRHRVLLCAQQACSVCEACARPTSPRLATQRLLMSYRLRIRALNAEDEASKVVEAEAGVEKVLALVKTIANSRGIRQMALPRQSVGP